MAKLKTITLLIACAIVIGTVASMFLSLILSIAQVLIVGMIVWGLYITIKRAIEKG